MKIPIELQRNITRYIDEHQMGNRAVAKLLKVSHNTVNVIRLQLQLKALTWVQLAPLDNIAFAQQLGTAPTRVSPRKAVPDWLHIQTELKKRDLTLELLWQEFRETEPNGVSYQQMARLFRAWTKKQRLSMRQIYKAGEKMFVDFCGRTMPITNRDTGEVSMAQVFVGVLGGSGRFFVWAVPSQQIAHWQECHIKAFEYFGGVPQQVVPDNLKSAVISHGRHHVVLNRAFAEMAEHYKFVILPGRPLKPRDKALAEVTVQIVQRGVLAPLRNRTFFSVAELNEAILPLVEAINQKTTKKFPRSRLERFKDIDAPALQALPETPYEPCDWQYKVRVSESYVVEWQRHLYSVPSQYTFHLVDLRITATMVEVFCQRQRIATHPLKDEPGGQSILREHMPSHHCHQQDNEPEALLQWAKDIGPNTYEFARLNLTERSKFANGLKTLQQLRRWAREAQNAGRLESACGYAVRIKALSFTRLESIIRHNSDQRAAADNAAPPVVEHDNLRGAEYFASQEIENVE